MKKVLLVVMVIAAMALNTKSFASANAPVLGTWKVEAPDAPWEYAKTTLVITETNNVLAAKLVTEDKQELKVNTIEFAKDVLKFSLMIDGNNIMIEGKLADSKITGAADTPDGEIKFTAVKAK
jgi:hypothetical protein